MVWVGRALKTAPPAIVLEVPYDRLFAGLYDF